MSKPTKEQLEKINRFTRKELTEDDVYVFPNMMIDNEVTSYYTIIHENLLRKFSNDVRKGVGLILSHDSSKLPVGRSFDSMLVEEWDEETGDAVKSLYGDFYIALGRNTESGMTTDDIVKGIDTGTIFDTSIGFSAKAMECSICGRDIRSWECPHYPGREYIVENDEGVGETVTCYGIIGKDGVGELIENSLVYAGACTRARIVNEYSSSNDSITENMPKLHLVKDLKEMPLDSNVYQFYTAHGLVVMTDNIEGKRSGNEVNKYKEILQEFDIKSEDELKNKFIELNTKTDEIETISSELADITRERDSYREELDQLKESSLEKEEEITQLNSEIEKLTKIIEELKVNEELIETYKLDLKNEIIELGIRSQGNAFNKKLFERFLDTLSIEEIKEIKEGFNEEVLNKFSGVKTSQTKVKDKKGSKERLYREDFETEVEFREHIAKLADKYAKDEGVSIVDATKIMYEKYLERGDE